ncbi:Lrp/AsnC family transcriptional regulator [Phyllobacterium sp. 21LDTY02-6]|jgi:DNA-binding Lrp family transcriptional regulator|uniref:Lrp/AsnC family transcriptional regulator n=1 Tax=unclassified Phyllobacterium TaxID=2638441 RepID=UPI00202112E4|nr:MULTISPECIES: Lrp/AsnC family transcriptional regulator [unclassified Phyllobacterium]MCO4316478.1 Lrp/AsnC family transcriptional regulator [Phyllobacterium sp. 21LDTY02-6]MCX8280720.1 Lrp/AsnC family transcriptional regulator [Phyllobacterium sp. 0TCS1.6C]MCX8292703.1 Lrp/AsnC family transcriptional regulator [Phyllobacterium sp. 0TCS1.6A]
MDDTDRRILALMRDDCRVPLSSMATILGISRATVRSRIDRMVDDGTIQGFTVNLRAGAGLYGVRAIAMVEVAGQAAEKVVRRLQGFPEIKALHTTNGRWDIVAEIEVETLEAFDKTLRDIRHIDGITSTETSILLSTRKSG